MASLWAYMCSILRVHTNHSLFPSIPKFTDLICSVHKYYSCQKVASIWACMCSILRVHSNHSLCPSITKFTDLIPSVHQDPNRQKVASIWAYMCSILRVHHSHSLCLSRPKFTDLFCSVIYHELTFYVQHTKNQAVKKWLQFELICAVYLEYIVTIHFVRPYQICWLFMFNTPRP